MGSLAVQPSAAADWGARSAPPSAAAPAAARTDGKYDRFVSSKEEAPKSILEAMREAREQAEETAKKYKIKTPVRYGDMPLEAYGRLNRARSKADAAAAAGYARRCLARLRGALHRDEDQAGAIRCAMRQLEKVAVRASRKKRDIDREHLMELRRRRAAEEQRRRESVRLHAELQRRRAVRSIRESGYLQEAVIEQGFQAYRDATAAQLQAQLPSSSAAAAAPSAPDAAAPAAPAAEFCAEA